MQLPVFIIFDSWINNVMSLKIANLAGWVPMVETNSDNFIQELINILASLK